MNGLVDVLATLANALVGMPLVWLLVTVGAFEIGTRLNKACRGYAIVNPVLIAMGLVIALLLASGIDHATYLGNGGGLVAAVLGPATVALAVPLYGNARRVGRAAVPVACAVLVAGMVAAATGFTLAWILGAPDAVLRSIAVKSVTAPIAIGVAEQIGGVASLAAAFAVLTGVTGCILSPWLLHRVGVTSLEAVGLATGFTAHGQGTARMLAMDETAGAFASVGMGANALATAVWLPIAVALLGG